MTAAARPVDNDTGGGATTETGRVVGGRWVHVTLTTAAVPVLAFLWWQKTNAAVLKCGKRRKSMYVLLYCIASFTCLPSVDLRAISCKKGWVDSSGAWRNKNTTADEEEG